MHITIRQNKYRKSCRLSSDPRTAVYSSFIVSYSAMYMLYVVGVVTGVAYLDNIMYVICYRSSTIRLYNTDTLSPLDVVINVTGMKLPRDIVVCRHDRQLYIA